MKIIDVYWTDAKEFGTVELKSDLGPWSGDGKYVDIDTARQLREMLERAYYYSDDRTPVPAIVDLLEETKELAE